MSKGGNFYNELYEFTKERGYTAWSYNLGGNKTNPIVISFIDVEISEAFTTSEGGLRKEKDEVLDDYKIGTITYKALGERKEKEWDIYQKGGYIKTLMNTYLKRGGDKNTHFGGNTYLHNRVNLLPEFKSDYE